MSSSHDRSTAPHDSAPHDSEGFDWLGQVKLAVVLSVVAAVVAVGLSGRVSELALVLGTIVVASLVGWSRIPPVRQHHTHVHLRIHARRH